MAMQGAEKDCFEKARNFYRKYGKNHLQNGCKRCIIYKWPWQPDAFSVDISAHFADFVPQEKKYVAFIAACPSQHDKLSRSK